MTTGRRGKVKYGFCTGALAWWVMQSWSDGLWTLWKEWSAMPLPSLAEFALRCRSREVLLRGGVNAEKYNTLEKVYELLGEDEEAQNRSYVICYLTKSCKAKRPLRQVDLRLGSQQKLDFGLLWSFTNTLNSHLILAEVNTCPNKFDDMFNEDDVKVLATTSLCAGMNPTE
ncbi:hypothetical protein BJY52DRAFT_1418887 [Lactarius psammicola]|nr:hypothetical protein BJY52DRAFT_1418887 [Lactarius psammicola]